MARLSGLASDHHPEGPGDGPRRRRGRKSRASSSQGDVPSSPMKRAHSPAAEVSTKRSRLDTVDEDEVEASRSQPVDTITLVSQTERVRRTRRYSEPLGAQEDEAAASSSRQFKASRRARMSLPAHMHLGDSTGIEGVREVQFAPLGEVLDQHTRRRLRRNHLSEEMNDYEDHKKRDAKLRKAYAELRRQLREKEQQIEDLKFQLEARRLGNIEMSDNQTDELRHKLEAAQQEIEELRNSSVYAPDGELTNLADADYEEDDDDDDELLLAEELMSDNLRDASPISNGPYASRALETSQVTIKELSSFDEATQDNLAGASQAEFVPSSQKLDAMSIQRYDTEIQHLMRQAADARGALRCLTIELQNLDIVAPGSSATEILATWRQALEVTRDEYEKLFGRSTAGFTSEQFIKTIMEELKGMNAELLEKIQVAQKLSQRVALVETQYEKSIDLLADSEAKNSTFNKQVEELTSVRIEQSQQLEQLQDNLERETELSQQLRNQIADHEASITGLQDDLEDKETNLQRLTEALETYRNEVHTMTETITRLETEHREQITEMEQDHAQAVEELQTQLEAETADRAEAEAQVLQKDQAIEELQERVENLDREFDRVSRDVSELRERLANEETARISAEEDRDLQVDLVEEHNITIQDLKEQLANLEGQLADLTTNLEAERTQRQQTETDLAEANETIEDLESQIRTQGIQANELRSKLFQVQQERETRIAELEEDAELRQQEHEELITKESERRKDAEEQVATLTAQIGDLENELTRTENTLTETQRALEALQSEREQEVSGLSRELEEERDLSTRLQAQAKLNIDRLKTEAIDLTNEVASLRATVADLEATAAETAQKQEEEITERNDVIAGLENELLAERDRNEQLQKANLSLEKRVESEACELLNIMSAHAQEANALRETIDLQQASIAQLQANAQQQATKHMEEIAEKEQEIKELAIVGEARAENIAHLQAALDEIKQRFREQAEDSQNTIDALLETNRQAIQKQEELAAATKKRTADALEAVAQMKVKGLEVKTSGLNLKKVVSGKVTKVNDRIKISKKKSVAGRIRERKHRDSGFVEPLDDDDGQDELAIEDEGIVG